VRLPCVQHAELAPIDILKMQIPAISFLMIDLGKFNFNIKMLDLAKAKILTNIKIIFSTDSEPTILAS
jgi:hypothetical protein